MGFLGFGSPVLFGGSSLFGSVLAGVFWCFFSSFFRIFVWVFASPCVLELEALRMTRMPGKSRGGVEGVQRTGGG